MGNLVIIHVTWDVAITHMVQAGAHPVSGTSGKVAWKALASMADSLRSMKTEGPLALQVNMRAPRRRLPLACSSSLTRCMHSATCCLHARGSRRKTRRASGGKTEEEVGGDGQGTTNSVSSGESCVTGHPRGESVETLLVSSDTLNQATHDGAPW